MSMLIKKAIFYKQLESVNCRVHYIALLIVSELTYKADQPESDLDILIDELEPGNERSHADMLIRPLIKDYPSLAAEICLELVNVPVTDNGVISNLCLQAVQEVCISIVSEWKQTNETPESSVVAKTPYIVYDPEIKTLTFAADGIAAAWYPLTATSEWRLSDLCKGHEYKPGKYLNAVVGISFTIHADALQTHLGKNCYQLLLIMAHSIQMSIGDSEYVRLMVFLEDHRELLKRYLIEKDSIRDVTLIKKP